MKTVEQTNGQAERLTGGERKSPRLNLKTPAIPIKKPKEEEQKRIELPRLNIQMMKVTVVGDSALICHAWSQKAKKQMLDTQMKKAKVAKAAKDPEQDYKDSLYHDEDGDLAFPAVGFKSSAVDACSHVEGVTKVEARGAFHICGDMVKIDGKTTIREDMVRVGMGSADIRYRGEFKDWKATLTIRYNANVLSADQIVNLFNTAGFAVGVGEWRPEKNGSFGMYHVETDSEKANGE